mmetsp:Transcript_6268/g.25158  ORF Transcript_6268/g.25158 Transcript_6268/m.25158 type:complete len:465 (-) Transcript_6268:2722-4116(-)
MPSSPANCTCSLPRISAGVRIRSWWNESSRTKARRTFTRSVPPRSPAACWRTLCLKNARLLSKSSSLGTRARGSRGPSRAFAWRTYALMSVRCVSQNFTKAPPSSFESKENTSLPSSRSLPRLEPAPAGVRGVPSRSAMAALTAICAAPSDVVRIIITLEGSISSFRPAAPRVAPEAKAPWGLRSRSVSASGFGGSRPAASHKAKKLWMNGSRSFAAGGSVAGLGGAPAALGRPGVLSLRTPIAASTAEAATDSFARAGSSERATSCTSLRRFCAPPGASPARSSSPGGSDTPRAARALASAFCRRAREASTASARVVSMRIACNTRSRPAPAPPTAPVPDASPAASARDATRWSSAATSSCMSEAAAPSSVMKSSSDGAWHAVRSFITSATLAYARSVRPGTARSAGTRRRSVSPTPGRISSAGPVKPFSSSAADACVPDPPPLAPGVPSCALRAAASTASVD